MEGRSEQSHEYRVHGPIYLWPHLSVYAAEVFTVPDLVP